MAEKRSSDDADQNSVARDAEMIAAARDKIVGDNQTLESPGNRAPRFSGPPADSFVGYKIIKEVHRGGQGIVYQALQKATKRKVAIKVLKEGPFSGQADRARFDREVQILGQLNHPNIVTIHDSGSSAGCQFFVMDYIRGQPLDVYMASGERSIDETLRLFGKICDAVNSAHLRGVIHRDLKPGNIVVDPDGEPHVLDFGLAKVAVSEAEASAMTLTGQFVGSLGWASPEQAEGVPSKIDIRTDVYSLGVILYQMLTSKFPYEVVGNLRDVLDRIMRSEPARPSTIRRQINDELDTIMLKCLQKERERRYQTAGEVARDIERYLAGEPIEAKRDSGWYMFKKTIHRYRVAAAVSAALVFVIVVGLAVTLIFWQQAVRQRDRAVAAERTTGEARAAAEQARAAEAEQRLLAERHLRRLEEERERAEKAEKLAAQWLAELGQVQAEAQLALQSEIDLRQTPEQRPMAVAARQTMPGAASKPGQPLGFLDNVLAFADQTLEPAGRPSPGETPGVPEAPAQPTPSDQLTVEALARATLGEKYLNLGQNTAAETHLRDAVEMLRRDLGDDHPEVARTTTKLASVLRAKGDFAGAEALLREVLATRRSEYGDEHPMVAETLVQLAWVLRDSGNLDGAEPLMREALAIRRKTLGNDHQDTASSLVGLGWVSMDRGDLDQAAELFHEALEIRRRVLGDEHPLVITALNNLALLLQRRGQYAEAEKLFRVVLARAEQTLGTEHPHVAGLLTNLAMLRRQSGDLDGAEDLYRQALDTSVKLLGQDHPQVAYTLGALGWVLIEKGELAAAEPLLREELEIRRKLYGEQHISVVNSLNGLAALYSRMRDWDQAEDMYRQALNTSVELLGRDDPQVAQTMGALGWVLIEKGEIDAAEPLLRDELEIRRKLYGDADVSVVASLNKLAGLYARMGDTEACVAMRRETLGARQALLGREHPDVARDMYMLGAVLRSTGQIEEAEVLLTDALELQRKLLPPVHPLPTYTLTSLGGLLKDKGDADAAEPLLREAYDIATELYGAEDQQTAGAASMLGACLLDLERYEETEPVLLEAYSLLAEARGPRDPQTMFTLYAIVRLYEEWDQPEQAADWRAILKADSDAAGHEAAHEPDAP